MVPLWMFPVAITCGNTFVLKPSEKVPLSAVRLGELLIESGLPEGVFSIVHEIASAPKPCSPPESASRFVRRLDGRRPIHLRDRHASRQASAGRRRGQEPLGSSCPTPTSTRLSAPSNFRPSAVPASAAWPEASPFPSAASPIRLSANSAQRPQDECRPYRRRGRGRHGPVITPEHSRGSPATSISVARKVRKSLWTAGLMPPRARAS